MNMCEDENLKNISEKIERAVNLITNKLTPAYTKTRCLFYLRSLNSVEAALALTRCLTKDSILIDHEVAYVLGQLRCVKTIDFLKNLSLNEEYDPIVRHEAVEALGNFEDSNTEDSNNKDFNNKDSNNKDSNIGDFNNKDFKFSVKEDIIKFLDENFIKNSKHHIMISESAILAIDKLKNTNEDEIFSNAKNEKLSGNLPEVDLSEEGLSLFGSRDPAYPYKGSLEKCKEIFISISKNENKFSLIEKYQAMFALRDANNKDAVDILSLGFLDKSVLLRHEVAYVFGQMENPDSISILEKVLRDVNQDSVVRHEAAEALGGIGNETCVNILKEFLNNPVVIIRESAEVGLKIAELSAEEYLEF